jgi:hypothetical protein
MPERGHRARNVRFTLIILCWTIAIVLFTLAVHHAVLNQWWLTEQFDKAFPTDDACKEYVVVKR